MCPFFGVRGKPAKNSGIVSHEGILLVNMGSPEAPRPGPVRRYLREFLSDRRVIDIAAPARWLLLNLIILPLRPRRSAEAYAQIWEEQGSPLVRHGRDLTLALSELLEARFPDRYRVELAMRYGQPSIESALDVFRKAGIVQITVLPLYPQYSSAATASVIDEVMRAASVHWTVPALRFVHSFYDHAGFIVPLAERLRSSLAHFESESGGGADHVLFSFHSVPERQILRSDDLGVCSLGACCDAIRPPNPNCYRAHCFATARALAGRLALEPARWSVSFQSRLGRTPWLRPYTDHVLAELPERGVRRLVIVSPSFVADCLETLEELNMRGRESFLSAGGEHFHYVPCLNSDPTWVQGLPDILGLPTAPS